MYARNRDSYNFSVVVGREKTELGINDIYVRVRPILVSVFIVSVLAGIATVWFERTQFRKECMASSIIIRYPVKVTVSERCFHLNQEKFIVNL